MFHYKYFFTFLLLLSSVCFGQEQKSATRKPAQEFRGFSRFHLELSYISWKEVVSLKGPTGSEKTFGDYVGNALTVEYEKFWVPRWGAFAELGLLFGQASLGGSQSLVPYQESDVKWWGLKASYRGAYRISSQISTSLGPFVLNRQIDLPSASTVTDVESGADLNYGLVADLRVLLSSNFEIRSELGGLVQDASTLWSLGFGYRF